MSVAEFLDLNPTARLGGGRVSVSGHLKALRQFFDPEKHSINKDGLRAVLAQERLALSLITELGKALVHDSREIRRLQAKLHAHSWDNLLGSPDAAVEKQQWLYPVSS